MHILDNICQASEPTEYSFSLIYFLESSWKLLRFVFTVGLRKVGIS